MSADARSDALRQLGGLLTETEAALLASGLEDGDSLTSALGMIEVTKQGAVLALAAAAELRSAPDELAVVCRAVEGAHAATKAASAIWTLPGKVQAGALMTSLVKLVENARRSVVCSTFNFQTTSGMWTALRDAARRPGVRVRLYLDRDVNATGGGVAPSLVVSQLSPATVLQTTAIDGGQVRNHAKFIIVDTRWVVVTSANFSWSAENKNIELGVLLDDPGLANRIENQLKDVERTLYEEVAAPT